MTALRIAAGAIWAAFWAGWLLSALSAKRSVSRYAGSRGRVVVLLLVVVILRAVHPHALEIESIPIAIVGLLVLLTGLSLAVWARVHLGRNWGMPTSVKEDPELITSGPYQSIRHPIYTGMVVGLIGTALITNLLLLIPAALMFAFFFYSARVEERNLTAAFPSTYPQYQSRTKMLLPRLL